jgi:hypothetical protein
MITIAGHISSPISGLKYRVVRKPHGAPDSAYVAQTNEPGGLRVFINTFNPITGWDQTSTFLHADADGYYPFEDYAPDHSVEGHILGRWFSTPAEDGQAFDLRIDLSVDGNPVNDTHSNVVTVLVDNTAPTVALDINLGAGVICADFNPGETFNGHFTALDSHFKAYSFVIRPTVPAHGVLPTPSAGAYPAIADPGVASVPYTLNTTGMDPCGYSLTLQVSDRTNRDSGSGNNSNETSVGFCLRTLPLP